MLYVKLVELEVLFCLQYKAYTILIKRHLLLDLLFLLSKKIGMHASVVITMIGISLVISKLSTTKPLPPDNREQLPKTSN